MQVDYSVMGKMLQAKDIGQKSMVDYAKSQGLQYRHLSH